LIRCSLCTQEFDENDDLIDVRKKRHERKHDRSEPHGSYNQVWGKVEWLRI
jgi:hypothetical protein